MQENDNWIENLGLANCDLTDDAATILGTYLHRKQIGSLQIGNNKFSYKAMASLLENLSLSAESGRLKILEIGDTIHDEDENNNKKKQVFLDSLCALVRKGRLLASLDISGIKMHDETLQSYLCFAIQLSSSKLSIKMITWNGDFTKPEHTAKFSAICLESLPRLEYLSVLPKQPEIIEEPDQLQSRRPSLSEHSFSQDDDGQEELQNASGQPAAAAVLGLFESYEVSEELAQIQRQFEERGKTLILMKDS